MYLYNNALNQVSHSSCQRIKSLSQPGAASRLLHWMR